MMPPLVMQIHVLNRQGRALRLWVPLFLIWILLLPFAVVLLPALMIICVVVDLDPIHAFAALFTLIGSLSGTHIEVDTPNAFLFFHIF